jgi:hypothetical protein
MSHVEVHAPGVGEKSSIARRFIVSPVMQIENASPLDVKKMVSDLVAKPGRGMVWAILIHQESVFGFESKNTVQHFSSPQWIEAPSAGGAKDLPV